MCQNGCVNKKSQITSHPFLKDFQIALSLKVYGSFKMILEAFGNLKQLLEVGSDSF